MPEPPNTETMNPFAHKFGLLAKRLTGALAGYRSRLTPQQKALIDAMDEEYEQLTRTGTPAMACRHRESPPQDSARMSPAASPNQELREAARSASNAAPDGAPLDR
jgi:hypothetical protein